MRWLSDAKAMRIFHSWAAVTWVILALVTTGFALWAPDNKFLLAWVIFMSGYANAASHWGAREASGAEAHGSNEQD